MADIGQGFDRLAGIYDGLAGTVYGRAIRNAQLHFLDQWPRKAEILIVGGGTGWFLEAVLQQTDPARVQYVELSGEMIRRSRERIAQKLPQMLERVEFHQGTIHDWPQPSHVDVVATHFYLDLFNGAELRNEIELLHGLLRPGGTWSLSDFAYEEKGLMKPVSRFLVGTMYLFFRMAARIRSRKLEDYPALLGAKGLQTIHKTSYYGGMIRSHLFQKR
jgi:tRNA (cmo5U34)-methyltransferase